MSQTSGPLGHLVSQIPKVLLCGEQSELALVTVSGGFPGSPVVTILCFTVGAGYGGRFDPWSEN